MKPVLPLSRRTFVSGAAVSALGAGLVPAPAWAQATAQSPQASIRSGGVTNQGHSIYGRGAVLPNDLSNRINVQNVTASAVNQRVLAEAAVVHALQATNPNLASTTSPAVPAQYTAKATAVKNQGPCGCCWAFASMGAYEAAYLINNNVTINVSEQELLDCTFGDVNCIVGSWHELAFLYVQNYGAVDGNTYPYSQTKQMCQADIPRTFNLLNWGYVRDDHLPDEQLIASDTAIKQAILRYGPVVSAVTADDAWFDYVLKEPNGQANPLWATFPKGVFNGVPTTILQANSIPIDHEVLIVGWDDTAGDHGVWFIKNSWGTTWGENGYIKLPYGTCNIGTGAAWVLPNLPQKVAAASTSLRSDVQAINSSNKLKSYYPSLGMLR
jgi:cathepsin L